MNLEQRTRALLAVVETYRRQRHDELVLAAQAQARTLLRAARAEARQRVHKAVAEARSRVESEVAAAQAALETERRLAAQRRASDELALAWRALRPALLARWADASSRRKWVERLIQSARTSLPADGWKIEHASDWPAREQEETRQSLAGCGIALARCAPDASIAAGLRIRCGRNVLDATIEGLLDERAALEGRLLKALAAVRAGSC